MSKEQITINREQVTKQITNKEQVIKNKRFYLFPLLLITYLLSVFTACDNPTDTPEIRDPVKNGYGKISIDFTGNTAHQSARTVLPSTVFDKYEYTFTKEGATIGTLKTPGNDGFFTLEVGNYTVAVRAYIGAAEPYTLAASGVSSQFSVGSGNNDPVTVPLSGITAAVKGKFNYTITYPAGATVEITLQKWPALNNITLNSVNVSQGNGKTQTLELDAGSYLLTVLVSKNNLYAGISEAVRIYPAITTVYTKDFADEDMLALILPTVNDYNISNLTQPVGSVTAVTIMPKEGKSSGTRTIYYSGSTTLPTAAGTYTVTFDVAAVTGWNAVTGLYAGTLTINPNPTVADFTISGTGTFTYDGSVKVVTVTAISGKTLGAVTVKYNNSTTTPSATGTYTITFDVAAVTGWNAVTGLSAGTLTINAATPVADDFTISGLAQFYNGSARTVTVTAKSGKSGGTVTVKYNNSTTAPSALGTYTVTFDVAATTNWNAATGLSAGTLMIIGQVEMVYVPGGSFQMGDIKNEGDNREKPVHTVTLTGFSMGKYPVTQAQYEAVMGTNPSGFTSSPASGEVQGNRPVERVSWYDAIEFCNALSIQEGLSPYYSIDKVNEDLNNNGNDPYKWTITCNSAANGYRLPTEAQWEYAAKGGNGSPGNYTYAGSNTVVDVAWYSSNSGSKTHEVGKKAPNGLGLYDMSGNVWEWCWDWYGSYSSGTQTDPTGAASGVDRVVRGGWWGDYAYCARSAFRYYYYPDDRYFNIGFRLVRP